MNSAWAVEFIRVFSLFLMALVFGYLFNNWALAFLLLGLIYMAWTLVQLRTFEQWIRLGAKTSFAPEYSGIWQLVVQHINRTQKKNKQHKQRLSSLARRFEATIAAIPDATIVLNAQIEIEWTNKASLQLFGIDKTDIGIRLDNLIRMPELQSLLNSNAESQLEIESPLDRSKTLSINCVDFGEGQKLLTARDVTSRVAVQKLRKAFIANASHELRTPLTVISGYLELLETDPELTERLKNQVSNAAQQASRMQIILDDMLILSRLEAKENTDEVYRWIDIPSMLATLINDVKRTNAKDTHVFESHIDADLKVKANEREMYSLCQNLISNAVKYSPNGSVIKVTWQRKDGHACLSVADNGEGIAKEHINRLTERFYRVNVSRSRQIGGTGLGLSIVKHILENHGGHLAIVSELNCGSEFMAYLPESEPEP
jgi:two-component system, OmpR family, phosphate regulon sensor histidine kinase PhoR